MWYVKDLSKLTGISVQTLHYYDRIGLLEPNLRLSNNYRAYSAKDLLRLQQILALKFFGFKLSQIKELLNNNADVKKHFEMQASLLDKKAYKILEASKALKTIISNVDHTETIPWETTIKLIEVYNMQQQLEHSWVKDIFSDEELKEYVAFETEWRKNSTPKDKAIFEKKWSDLVKEIEQNLQNSPESEIGISVGEKCMKLINGIYGKKHAHLRTKKFEKGFGKGLGLNEVGLNLDTVAWLDKAIDAYWHNRIYKILDKVGSNVPDDEIFHLWNEVLDDMYGDDNSRKKEIYDIALADQKISNEAKEWLKTLRELTAANSHLL